MVFIDWHRRIIKLFFFFNFRTKYSLVVVEMRRWIGFLRGGGAHTRKWHWTLHFPVIQKRLYLVEESLVNGDWMSYRFFYRCIFPSVQIWGWVIGFIGLYKHQPSTKNVYGGFLEVNFLSFGVLSVCSLQRLHFCFSFLTSSGIFLMYQRSCKWIPE